MTNNLTTQLMQVRAKISALEGEEAELVRQIIQKSKHKGLGQKTYDMEGMKVVIKTGVNATIDKARLNVEWNASMPINRSYSYTLRQKDFDALMKHGTPEQKKYMSEIVTTKPAKPVVKIEGE